jgi:uncharacterized membrane protein SpoIIM required for sporulation
VDLDTFISVHRLEWSRLETALQQRSFQRSAAGGEISDLVRLYLRASSHLAEVQSRYHDQALEDYLNALVARAHGTIYSTEARSVRSLMGLLGARYRNAIWRTGRFIAVIAVLLGAVMLATDWWVATSPEARAGLIAPQAREAIEEAGGGGNPGDLAVPGPFLSTLIFQNNVQVAFLAFALGITLGIGTLYVVVQNAVFIGLLAGAYQGAGHAPLFWALVLPHGFLELTAICISAGAGLRMGWAIIEPGDRPRLQALREEATEAVLVVVGVVPAFAIAALIEGLVTGRTGYPMLEVTLGAVVAVAYLAFLFVPWRRATRAAPAP